MSTIDDIDRVINFWFANEDKWWNKDPEFDELIRTEFLDLYRQAEANKLSAWERSPEGILALILILDQFARNMFRDDAQAFALDHFALGYTRQAIALGYDQKLKGAKLSFLYMPLMHSEDLSDQELLISLYTKTGVGSIEYAKAHRDIIRRFGRFPHRNQVLGRDSTTEELEFLKQPGSSF